MNILAALFDNYVCSYFIENKLHLKARKGEREKKGENSIYIHISHYQRRYCLKFIIHYVRCICFIVKFSPNWWQIVFIMNFITGEENYFPWQNVHIHIKKWEEIFLFSKKRKKGKKNENCMRTIGEGRFLWLLNSNQPLPWWWISSLSAPFTFGILLKGNYDKLFLIHSTLYQWPWENDDGWDERRELFGKHGRLKCH